MNNTQDSRLDPKIILGYLVQEISGKGKSDTTVFHWQNGSICSASPPIPLHLRGSDLFRKLKILKPTNKFNGSMQVFRQDGEIKDWKFNKTE